MCPIKDFMPNNPTGEAPGMEPLNMSVLKAAVANIAEPQPTPPSQPSLTLPPPAPAPHTPTTVKTLRLPSDLVEFIDYVYTKDMRMRKQDAYTQALEQVFRPLMAAQKARG